MRCPEESINLKTALVILEFVQIKKSSAFGTVEAFILILLIMDNGDYDSIERCRNNVKTAYSATAKKVLGYRKRKSKTWISMAAGKK